VEDIYSDQELADAWMDGWLFAQSAQENEL
jgi:hypothetical protein